jgi:hypothetical protein
MAKSVTKQTPSLDDKAVLSILFPSEEVEIGGGKVVTVRPLSLEHLKDVLESFQKVISFYQAGDDAPTILFKGFKEVMELLPFCIDVPMGHIPSGYAPDILEAFLRQNLAEDTLGKWTALIQTLNGELQKRFPSLRDLNQSESNPEVLDTK